MINDMNLSNEIDKRFSEEVKDLPVPVNVKVLTNGHWPTQQHFLVKIPPALNYV